MFSYLVIPHADIWPNVVIYYYLLIIFWLVEKAETEHNKTLSQFKCSPDRWNGAKIYVNSSNKFLDEVTWTPLCLASPEKEHAEGIFISVLFAVLCAICLCKITPEIAASTPCFWELERCWWVTWDRWNQWLSYGDIPALGQWNAACTFGQSFSKDNTHISLN